MQLKLQILSVSLSCLLPVIFILKHAPILLYDSCLQELGLTLLYLIGFSGFFLKNEELLRNLWQTFLYLVGITGSRAYL